MMKRWTQQELDAVRGDSAGQIILGTGDFSECNLYGRNRVVIGADSIIGAGMQKGDSCEIGERCQIGEGFSARKYCKIGEGCHFGPGAKIGEASMIGAGCCFGDGCEIAPETMIREGVELPRRCTVFGIEGVDGKSMLRMGPIIGRQVYAFEAAGQDGARRVYAGCTGVPAGTLTAFAAYIAERQARQPFAAHHDDTWSRMRRAAAYIYDHFGAE